MVKQKEIVKTVSVDGAELVLAVKHPSNKLLNAANRVYSKAWVNAIEKEGLPLKAKVDQLSIKSGLWDDSKTEELKKISESLNEKEKTLAKGGIPLWGLGVDKKSAQKIAIEMIQDRSRLFQLINEQNQFYGNTAEAYAETAKVNFIIVESVVYNDTGAKYFKSVEDYEDRVDEKASIDATQAAFKILYPNSDHIYDELPENQFLKKYKMVDDDGRFLDKDGHLVDITGRRINDRGQYINEQGETVDYNGNRIDDKGNYVENFTPFLDDEGNPIEE